MARTSKMPRYEAFNNAINCFGEKTHGPDTWRDYLDAKKALYLELGCGKAEVTLANARLRPEHNFIGVDLKADRLWRPAKIALEENLRNVAFLQSNILDIESYFKPHTIWGIWITFPDPFPKKRQAKHRMLNRNFLDIYKKLLKTTGKIYFKTDNKALYNWAIELLHEQKDIRIEQQSSDLHASTLPDELKTITTYEKKFMDQGQPIYFVRFSFA